MLNSLLHICKQHNDKIQTSFSMVASENVLSPLASLASAADFNNRYFFDDPLLWGPDAFHGGKLIGRIQTEILEPILKTISKADFINVKPISGLNCMTAVLHSYCKNNDLVFCLPSQLGGHSSTAKVAFALNLQIKTIPFLDQFTLDLEKLGTLLKKYKPRLIYIDQCCVLVPIDINSLANCIRNYSPATKLHVDTSHLNGIILSGLLENPLQQGANSFGGSTHKTIPGPIKGFFATSEPELAVQFKQSINYLVSHSHTGNMVALAITLIEFKNMGGHDYIAQTLKNAQMFANELAKHKINVQGEGFGYTKTHQVWVDTLPFAKPEVIAKQLAKVGVIVSCFPFLPGLEHGGLRFGLNQPTRYGLKENEIILLAQICAEVILTKETKFLDQTILQLRSGYKEPKYCYSRSQAEKLWRTLAI